MKNKTYFITAIDTDTGKTYVTGAFARYLHKADKRVITQKIAQTGCVDFSEDIQKHREIMEVDCFEEDKQGLTCPFIFTVPASPHLAAELDNSQIDPRAISVALSELRKRYDYVICEGVGGLYVPLTRDVILIDWLREQNLPTVLVTSGKLGSINHTLMSLDACLSKGIDVVAVVYNFYPDVLPEIEEDTVRVIKDYIDKYIPECHFIRLGDIKSGSEDSFGDFSVLV